MASDAQISANRQNAIKSTGPKTESGKSASSANAIKHSLWSKKFLVRGEDAEEFQDLWRRLETELKPVGTLEEFKVEQIAFYMFRIRRCRQIEAQILSRESVELQLNQARAELGRLEEHARGVVGVSPDKLSAEERDLRARIDRLAEIHSHRSIDLGAAFRADADRADLLSKLSVYEGRFERGLTRAVREFQRLHLFRFGLVPASLVNISADE